MKILRLETEFLRVPLKRPVALPVSQDPRSASSVDLVIVRVITDGPAVGLGFTHSFGGGTAIRSILDEVIAPVIEGANPLASEWLFLKAAAELETLGFAGAAARAYAAVDFALWDLKGKAAGLPLYQLLGGYRTKLKAVVTDTATPALGVKQAAKETRAALDYGAAGVQIEVGTLDPELDAERLRQLREEIPDGAWFEISAGGRYDFASAVWLGSIGTEEFGLDGFNDPLNAHDHNDLQRLIDRLDVGLSVGAHFDRPESFLPLLEAGGVSAIRIDPLRLGGITPARKVAAAAELKHIAVYPVRTPEVGSHLAAGVVYGRMCEYVDWFAEVFEGGPTFENGQLVVSSEPGLGLKVNERVAAKLRQ
jgi:L-alanine-DL-glutamate epimerase-like enolase superfamily enzyme